MGSVAPLPCPASPALLPSTAAAAVDVPQGCCLLLGDGRPGRNATQSSSHSRVPLVLAPLLLHRCDAHTETVMRSLKERKKDHLTCCRSTREHHWPLWGITALSAQLRASGCVVRNLRAASSRGYWLQARVCSDASWAQGWSSCTSLPPWPYLSCAVTKTCPFLGSNLRLWVRSRILYGKTQRGLLDEKPDVPLPVGAAQKFDHVKNNRQLVDDDEKVRHRLEEKGGPGLLGADSKGALRRCRGRGRGTGRRWWWLRGRGGEGECAVRESTSRRRKSCCASLGSCLIHPFCLRGLQERLAADPENNVKMDSVSDDIKRALGALSSEDERLKAAAGGACRHQGAAPSLPSPMLPYPCADGWGLDHLAALITTPGGGKKAQMARLLAEAKANEAKGGKAGGSSAVSK